MQSRVFIALVAAALSSLAAAEQPDWDNIAQRLLVIRHHQMYPHPQYQGLWLFDPDSQGWERLRYFSFNSRPDVGSDSHGGALTAADGMVSFQAWPMNLDFEAGSWRLLRRTSPVADPAARGWAIQGPAVGRRDAARLGLAPGTYGIAFCGIKLFYAYPYLPPAPECLPYELSDSGTSIECTDSQPWPLLHRSDDGRLELAALMPPLDWYPQWEGYTDIYPTLTLSFDPERGAFWRGTPRGVELLPVDGGIIGQPSENHSFDFPPFDDPEFMVEQLYYHPGRHQVFMLGRAPFDHPMYGSFLALNEALEPAVNFDNQLGETGPVAFTSLGEQPESLEQLVPVVAHAPGWNDTEWTSDLWLFNPSDAATSVELRRVAAPSVTRTVQLEPHASLKVEDALAFLGGGPAGDGAGHDAVVLTSPYRWGDQLVAASRCFTTAAEGGTFGHAVTAVPGRAGYSNHLVYPGEPEPEWMNRALSWLPNAGPSTLYADYRVPGTFRHNLGIVNDFDETVTITLRWGHLQLTRDDVPGHDPPATAVQTVEVEPHSLRIVQLDTLFPTDITGTWPPRIAVWGSRPVPIWLSMVDNRTGDATFVPYSLFHWAGDVHNYELTEVRSAVPVVAHTQGDAGTTWRTDLYGADWLPDWYQTSGWLHPADPAGDCGGVTPGDDLYSRLFPEVAQSPEAWTDDWSYWGTVVRDVARAFPACSGDEHLNAALELQSATWLIGYTRTYTTRADGGTYGEMLPFYPLEGWPVQHFAGVELGAQYRVNVGLYNGDHEHAITHRISLYAADGSLAAERMITLQPLASLQRRLEHLFGMEVGALPSGTYGMTVLPLDEPANGVKGRCWAWVSLVDQVTGDPTNWW